MHEMPHIVRDLALMLSVAGLISLVFHRWGQASIIGFLIAGVCFGPNTGGLLVTDQDSIKVWAEIGVIFLFFAMGLKFRMGDLLEGSTKSLIASLIQMSLMMTFGALIAFLLGFDLKQSLIWGAVLSICSSVVVSKLLPATMEFEPLVVSNTVVRIILVEDFFAIIVLTAMSSLSWQPSLSATDVARSFVQLIGIVAIWIVMGRNIVPYIFRHFGKTKSEELIVLAGVAACFAMVSLAAFFDYSIALGAFIMGSLLSETKEGPVLYKLLVSMKDVFGAIFFLSIGMMLDPQIVAEYWVTVLVFSVFILSAKFFAVYIGARATQLPKQTSFMIAKKLPHIGEFSIILMTLANSLKFVPDSFVSITVATAIITILFSQVPGRLFDQLRVAE